MVSAKNISNINKNIISKVFSCVIITIANVNGIIIKIAFVNIFAACFLVKYSSSIFIISSLLLIFSKYLFINGIFKYLTYSFWYNISVESGIFQADMKVEIMNDGPVTLIVDTPKRRVCDVIEETQENPLGLRPKELIRFQKEAEQLKRNLKLRKEQRTKNG